MSSNIFENLQSPVSHDADLDKGWQQISEKGDDPVTVLFGSLMEIYWAAVVDEMANAILAFDDYKTFIPGGLQELAEEALESDYLRELLDLWDPLGLPKEVKDDLCQGIFSNVKERQNVSQDELVARSLLQACGFTDYDYVQEYRRPTFPSLGPAPQVDTRFPGVYEAVQCSECRFCIRSFHFYECKKGCIDCTVNRNHLKTVLEDKKSKPTSRDQHYLLDCLVPPPFRLCCTCMETSSHKKDHLKVVYRFKKAGDEENRKFSRELDALEDHIKGQSLLSFGNAFLDHLSLGGWKRSSVSSRRLFPAGNAHCALMFGPLLIENGMTIYPGGALISARPLPSLGRHTSREIKEYLRPENFRTIDGCDMFCSPLYSVSPDRRFYEAMKRTRERRFLCARKQLSGGLFTDYNGNPLWRLGEPKLVEQFLNLTLVWRAGKAPAGSEKFNRDLLLECAGRLAASMQAIFGEEIKPHLFMLAQKLGKKQKLAYSRMSNNCQDFCNGLLDYDSYIHPMVSAMYPFIPVGLSADIEQAADDRSLSYLQSFVKPLQYPIQGGRSRRMMLGSAITMYSSSAQNDADLIDHVYSVRFGYDSENHFSLGFTLGPKRSSGDPYLLKDEEMSCSDRFAASNLPLSTEGLASCSLADHLLDCPQDNLSILQTHLLRQKKYYIDEDGEFLVNLGPKAWMKNRLEILRRLSLMNAFLAEIAKHFQACCWELLPQVGVVNVKTLMKTWRPANTIFSRAWHLDKRDGNKLYYAPDLDFGDGEMSNYKAVGFFTLGTPLFETHRQVLDGENLFMTRLKTLKSLLSSRLAGKDEVWSPWECCTCPECNIHRLQFLCQRLDWNFITVRDARKSGDAMPVKPGHPDYVSPQELERFLNGQNWGDVTDGRKINLEWEEERHEKSGSQWVQTYLQCLRIIFDTDKADSQLLRERLEYYRLVFAGKELPG